MHSTSLYLALRKHFKWQYETLAFFLQSEAISILLMTLLRVVSQLLQLLSLFLPLKIILILTADQASIRVLGNLDPDKIDSWLVLLTITVVISYFLSIAVKLFSNRINVRISTRLVELLRPVQDEDDFKEGKLRAIFYKLFIGYAEITLFIIGCLLLLWLDPFVSAVVIIGFVLELLLTMLILTADKGIIGFVASAIKRNPVGYIHYLSAFNFILFFLALLLEHVVIGKLDTVIAILSLLLARKIFRSLGVFISNALKLEASSGTEYFSSTMRARESIACD